MGEVARFAQAWTVWASEEDWEAKFGFVPPVEVRRLVRARLADHATK